MLRVSRSLAPRIASGSGGAFASGRMPQMPRRASLQPRNQPSNSRWARTTAAGSDALAGAPGKKIRFDPLRVVVIGIEEDKDRLNA